MYHICVQDPKFCIDKTLLVIRRTVYLNVTIYILLITFIFNGEPFVVTLLVTYVVTYDGNPYYFPYDKFIKV